MSNAALAFLAGLGGGYMEQREREREEAHRAQREQRENEAHQARMTEFQRKKASDEAVRVAAQPISVKYGAEPPPIANDDDGNPMPPVSTFQVQDKRYDTEAQASTAAAAANAPQAVRTRQVAALQGIDPERAMKIDDAAITIEKRAKELQDEGVFDGLKAFRAGDPVGMKTALNKSGQFKIDGDVTLQPEVREIPGVGKVTTYNATFNAVGPDGKIVPRQVNSHDLSLQMMPYEKALELGLKGTKEQREGKKDESIVKENEAKADYYRAAAGAQDTKANKTPDGKPFKLDEDDKLRLTTANQRVRDAEKAVTDAMGKLMPGEDATKNQGVAFAQNLLRQAKVDHLRTNIVLGQIKPQEMATQIIGVAKDAKGVLASLSDLANMAGTDFADQVATEVQKTDAWKRMNPQPRTQPAGGKPAAAAGMPAAAPAAPKKELTPADAAGQRLDQAREVLRRLRASAPGLAKGREAIDAHAESVRAAQQELLDAEAAYQRMVEGSVKPYFGGGRAAPAAAAGMTAGR